MNNNSAIGNLGEDLACRFIMDRGFKTILRNFRKPWGELDIIAKDPTGVLVFIEVKTILAHTNQNDNFGLKPEDNLTNSKLKKLQRTAQIFVGNNQELIDDKRGWRIDLIAITIPENLLSNDLTELMKHCDTKHFENI